MSRHGPSNCQLHLKKSGANSEGITSGRICTTTFSTTTTATNNTTNDILVVLTKIFHFSLQVIPDDEHCQPEEMTFCTKKQLEG